MLLVISTGAYYPPVATTGVVNCSLPCIQSQHNYKRDRYINVLLQEHIMLKMAKLEFENHKTNLSLVCIDSNTLSLIFLEIE